ncbi:MAG: ABC transporter ATP-binding protein/permease [Clostridiales bacterium]|nr:ABC transporter ATP-binding protein/permease [Clostridiales bacterium]
MNEFDEQEYTKGLDIGLWKRIYVLVKSQRKRIVAVGAVLVMVALCDMIFPLLNLHAIDTFIGAGDLSGLVSFIFLYLGVAVWQALNVYLFVGNCGKLESHVVYHIRKTGFAKLQELSFSYYDTTPVGWIMARMTSDAQRIGDVVAWSAIDLVWGICVIVFVSVCMFIINVKLALITLCVFPILAVVSYFFQKVILKNYREVRKLNSKITGAYNEGINGARTTKTLTRESRNFDEFENLSRGMKTSSIRAAVFSAIYLPIVMGLGSVGVALVLWRGGMDVQGGLLTFGTYSLFITYGMQIYDPVYQLARVLSEFTSAQASAERTLSLIETSAEIIDPPEILEKFGDNLNPKRENWPSITGDILFEDVSFSYKTGEKVLKNFNLKIEAGQKIALVGETGAGKSTIVNLICRFYEPTSGRVLIDGTDYRERSQLWLQSNLGYVLQTPHLFSGTVADNIRYAKQDATAEEVEAAAKTVDAHKFIVKLEKGYDTEVGEGGSRLSSGQKQLISFARAIIGDPRIFVLDEATSSVDTETESMISQAVDKVLRGRTSFIVAHRLSTIRSCDRILVIKDGEVAESGNHRELLKRRGIYYNLYTNQFMAEQEQKILG